MTFSSFSETSFSCSRAFLAADAPSTSYTTACIRYARVALIFIETDEPQGNSTIVLDLPL